MAGRNLENAVVELQARACMFFSPTVHIDELLEVVWNHIIVRQTGGIGVYAPPSLSEIFRIETSADKNIAQVATDETNVFIYSDDNVRPLLRDIILAELSEDGYTFVGRPAMDDENSNPNSMASCINSTDFEMIFSFPFSLLTQPGVIRDWLKFSEGTPRFMVPTGGPSVFLESGQGYVRLAYEAESQMKDLAFLTATQAFRDLKACKAARTPYVARNARTAVKLNNRTGIPRGLEIVQCHTADKSVFRAELDETGERSLPVVVVNDNVHAAYISDMLTKGSNLYVLFEQGAVCDEQRGLVKVNTPNELVIYDISIKQNASEQLPPVSVPPRLNTIDQSKP